MNKTITSFVGLDTHVDSIAIGVAPRGRQEPRFVGTVPPQWGALSKPLGRLGKPKRCRSSTRPVPAATPGRGSCARMAMFVS